MTGSRVSVLADALLAPAQTESAWEDYRELPPDERAAVVALLKERIDALVRSDPPAALAVVPVLERAGAEADGQGALVARGRAVAAHANGRGAEALAAYVEAARLYATAGDELERARVLRSLVDVYQMAGRTDDALRAADEARAVFEARGEERLLAQLEINLGNVFVRLDEYGRARDHYRAAAAGLASTGSPVERAIVQYNLGVAETNANDCEAAEGAFAAAREAFDEADMAVHVADCDYMQAYLESRRGRFADAIAGLERARAAYRECGKPSGEPLCDLDLAEIYLRLDARRDCLEHADRAAARCAELSLDYERAKALLFRGMAHARLGNEGAALEDLDRGGELFGALSNRAWPAVLAIHRSALARGLEDPEKTLRRLRAARESVRDLGLRLWGDLATAVIARAHTRDGDLDAAHAELDGLLAAERDDNGLDRLVRTEARIVRAEARLTGGDRQGAVTVLREAVDDIDRSASQVPGTDVRTAFFRDRHEAFALLAWLLAETEGPATDEAFDVLERGRLRSFLDAARGAAAGGPELTAARERLDWLLGRRLDAELGPAAGDHDARGLAPTTAEILDAERSVTRLARVRDQQGTDAAPALLAVRSPELRAVLGPDELVLAYLSTARGSRVFLVERDRVESRLLDLDLEEIARLRNRLFFQMKKYRLGSAYRDRHAARLQSTTELVLAELGRRLLEPLRERLAGRPLCVLPYGGLHDLPFHAMRVDGRALVETNDVSYAHSATQLTRCRTRARGASPEVVLAGADDATLPAIAGEIADLRSRYGDSATVVPPERLAAHLRAEPARGGLLHIAAHGTFRPENPVFSGLRLGRTFLTAHDLESTRLAYDLVTLSGCETGRSLHVPGEELFGLSRTLFAAGVRSVLSSLWAVSDDDSAAFMHAFYDRLAAGATAREAVAGAQREIAAERPHPCAWAAFALSGDPAVQIPSRTAARGQTGDCLR